ncbi:hypothetical protein PUR58_04845 [Streptomyces sp. JV186]|uniref:HD domain-containing protein n=1 Tax=Streptomyces sp. JV186 TaxID=858639 RepID=UPI002E774BFF|nr:hypothetical protein [Streptomyces sp. JV186]MEE1722311.1 hypothetical protein [Streptomyces sp. JV186]
MASVPAGPAPAADPRPALVARWVATVDAVRGPDAAGPAPEPYAENLLGRWAEPQRAYHTVAHLTAVLDRIDLLAAHSYAEDIELVRLAAWFHDAVYLPERDNNEERSARLAERALAELGLDERRVAEVVRLVRLTLSHDPADADGNGAVLCDADLGVLAGSPEEYAAYASAVRTEYGFVEGETFRAVRAELLLQMLERPALFRTEYGHRHWEEQARQNLRTELDLLVM